MIQLNASLFVKKSGYTIAGTSFDIMLSESHSLQSTIAEQPLEEGSSVALHIHNKLREGELEGLIFNWSINAPLFVNKAWLNFVGLAAGPNRAVDFYNFLKSLREKKQLFTIVLGLDTYDNVFFTQIDAMRDADSGESQKFKVRFKELKFVKLARTEIDVVVSPAAPTNNLLRQASQPSDQGLQPGETVEI